MRKIVFILVLLTLIGSGYKVWHRENKQATNKVAQSVVKNSSTPPKAILLPATFDKTKYSLTDPASIWVVANKSHPLSPLRYAPSDLTHVEHGQLMRQAAAKAFYIMLAAAQQKGLVLHSLSGYRSYDTQITVYAKEVNDYGQKVADTQSAQPGYSEHQTGLALDLGGGGCNIEDCFANTAEGKWVAANAHKFGFIIRYPKGKQAITGYRYEPWHIRYVGTALATEMHRQGIQTLEEYFGL